MSTPVARLRRATGRSPSWLLCELAAAALAAAGVVAASARRAANALRARLTIRLNRAGGSESWEPADPGNVRWKPPYPAESVNYAPRPGATATGADPPCPAFLVATARPRLGCPDAMHGARYTRSYSERCCGIPASRARTSVSLYRRWPPSVRIDVSLPALAQRVTVFGSTRNIVATSAGVRSGSASGVRADMCTASPPGPALRSCCGFPWLHWKPAVDVLYGLLEPYCHHQP